MPASLPRSAADPVDERLAAQPLVVTADFDVRLFDRLAAESVTADPALDSLLGAAGVQASPGFTGRVLAAVARERRRRILRFVFPAAAACLVGALLLGVRPAADPDVQIARLLADDRELSALASLSSASPMVAFETDLAELDALGGAIAGDALDTFFES